MYTAKLEELAKSKTVDLLAIGPYGVRVYRGAVMVDFWPRTGTWRTPDGVKRGKGLSGMLDYLGVKG